MWIKRYDITKRDIWYGFKHIWYDFKYITKLKIYDTAISNVWYDNKIYDMASWRYDTRNNF